MSKSFVRHLAATLIVPAAGALFYLAAGSVHPAAGEEDAEPSPALAKKLEKLKGARDPDEIIAIVEELGHMGSAALPAVPELIKLFSDREGGVRSQAAWTVGELKAGGEEVMEALIELATDEKAKVRLAATSVLGETGDPETVEPLVKLLGDDFWQVRITAVKALAEIGDPDTADALIDSLQDEQAEVRQAAAEGLGKMSEAEAVEGLIELLNDEESGVRSAAVLALGVIRDPEAAEGLIGRLKDSQPHIRTKAGVVLKDLGPGAAELLIDAVASDDPWIRVPAAEALVTIADRRAIPSFRKMLEHQDSQSRELAVKGLSMIGPAAVESLSELYGDDNLQRRLAAVKALGPIDDPAARSLLFQALGDSDSTVRQNAAGELGRPGNVEAVQPLLGLMEQKDRDCYFVMIQSLAAIGEVEPLLDSLHHPDVEIRRWIVEVLGLIGDTAVLEPLTAALEDPDPRVRSDAKKALERLKDTSPDN